MCNVVIIISRFTFIMRKFENKKCIKDIDFEVTFRAKKIMLRKMNILDIFVTICIVNLRQFTFKFPKGLKRDIEVKIL